MTPNGKDRPEREAADRDPILDACLDEVLGGHTPPDLTDRIMAAIQARKAATRTVGAAATA